MESVINLNDNCYEICPFYFKGELKEIERLKNEFHIKEEGEIVCLFEDSKKIIDIIERYPSLMVMGFVEEWNIIHKVYVVFSSKDSTVINKCEFAGYFVSLKDNELVLRGRDTNAEYTFVKIEVGGTRGRFV